MGDANKSILRISTDGLKGLIDTVFRRGQQHSPRSMLSSINTSAPGYSSRRHSTPSEKPVGGVYTRRQWLQAILQGNDLVENNSSIRSIVRQVPIQAVSFGPSVMVDLKGDDEENTRGTELSEMLTRWGEKCDWYNRNGMTLHSLLFIAAIELQTANSFLIVFDDFILDNGKVLAFSAEQYAHMSKAAWSSFCKERGLSFPNPLIGYRSSGELRNGRVYDDAGRLVGYCVDTRRVYATESDAKDCMFIPAESAFEFSLPEKTYGDAMPPIASVYDNAVSAETLRGSQIETAINESKLTFAATGGRPPAQVEVGTDGDITEEEKAEVGLMIESTGELPEEISRQVEQRTGIGCVTVPKDSRIETLESKKPSKSVADHYERITRESGIALGLYSSMSQGKIDASYSAGRGEMVLSWSWLYIVQGCLDRGLRFVQAKKISHAVRTGTASDPAELDPMWENHIENIWPTMPQIDPEKEQNANIKGIEYGTVNYSDLFGPGWMRRFVQRRTEYRKYKSDEVPNKAYETTPGAVGTVPQPQKQ